MNSASSGVLNGSSGRRPDLRIANERSRHAQTGSVVEPVYIRTPTPTSSRCSQQMGCRGLWVRSLNGMRSLVAHDKDATLRLTVASVQAKPESRHPLSGWSDHLPG